MDLKTCTVCKKEKSTNEFGTRSRNKDGKRPSCKECEKILRKVYKVHKKPITNNKKDCSKCNKTLPIENFSKSSTTPTGYRYNCKICEKEARDTNPEERLKKSREYYHNNKDKARKVRRKWKKENKEHIRKQSKKYRENNKEKISKGQKEYRKNNKDKINKRQRDLINKNPVYKLRKNISCLIRNSILKDYKGKSYSEKILECDKNEFKNHIESQFLNWMSWDNYGLYNGELNYGWDLDHIVPVSKAETEEDVYQLNHYTNFQPLCSKINRDIKKNKIKRLSNIELKITITDDYKLSSLL